MITFDWKWPWGSQMCLCLNMQLTGKIKKKLKCPMQNLYLPLSHLIIAYLGYHKTHGSYKLLSLSSSLYFSLLVKRLWNWEFKNARFYPVLLTRMFFFCFMICFFFGWNKLLAVVVIISRGTWVSRSPCCPKHLLKRFYKSSDGQVMWVWDDCKSGTRTPEVPQRFWRTHYLK